MVPFVELKAQHQALEEGIVKVFREALRKVAFIGGAQVEAKD